MQRMMAVLALLVLQLDRNRAVGNGTSCAVTQGGNDMQRAGENSGGTELSGAKVGVFENNWPGWLANHVPAPRDPRCPSGV